MVYTIQVGKEMQMRERERERYQNCDERTNLCARNPKFLDRTQELQIGEVEGVGRCNTIDEESITISQTGVGNDG